MLGFVVVGPSVCYVVLCGCTSVSLICWAFVVIRLSEMLGFVVIRLSV